MREWVVPLFRARIFTTIPGSTSSVSWQEGWVDGACAHRSRARRSSASSPISFSSTRLNSRSVYHGFVSFSGRPRYIVNLSNSCSRFFLASSSSVGGCFGVGFTSIQLGLPYYVVDDMDPPHHVRGRRRN